MPDFVWNAHCIQFFRSAGLSRIAHKNRVSSTVKKPGGCNSTSCHSYNENHYLNFKVDRLNRAKINAAIQKRMMIFDSFQPLSSK